MPTLWQDLPFDLLVKVLAKLPISALTKFRQVCRRWKTLIHSVEFAQHCRSVKPAIFYHHPGGYGSILEGWEKPYLAFPNLKTNSWEKHFLDLNAESVDLVAADQGLMCFRPRGTDKTLYVHNPLTQAWKRLTVPDDLKICSKQEYLQSKLLVGLVMDRETGSYKLVAVFIDEDVPRETLIYDSQTTSWTTSAAVSPTLESYVTDGWWNIGRSLCYSGNLYWLVEQVDEDYDSQYRFKTLIKYDVKLDTWTIAKQNVRYQLPFSFHIATQNESVYMMSFETALSLDGFLSSFTEYRLEHFPREFLSLGPEIRPIDAEFRRMVLNLRNVGDNYYPVMAMAQDDTWYVAYGYSVIEENSSAELERARKPVYVLALDQSRRSSICLPGLHPLALSDLGTFAATFRAFV